MKLHACSMHIAGGVHNVVVQGLMRLTPAHPSDEQPPVMYGHFCMAPRESVHDRYHCTLIRCTPLVPNKTYKY